MLFINIMLNINNFIYFLKFIILIIIKCIYFISVVLSNFISIYYKNNFLKKFINIHIIYKIFT